MRSEHSFKAVQRWSSVIKRVIKDYPNPIWFQPNEQGLSVETFAARLRDATNGQNLYKHAGIFTEEEQTKLDDAHTNLSFAIYKEYVVCGERRLVRTLLDKYRPRKNIKKPKSETVTAPLLDKEPLIELEPKEISLLCGFCILLAHGELDNVTFLNTTIHELKLKLFNVSVLHKAHFPCLADFDAPHEPTEEGEQVGMFFLSSNKNGHVVMMRQLDKPVAQETESDITSNDIETKTKTKTKSDPYDTIAVDENGWPTF